MVDAKVQDLAGLSRDVARAAAALARWQTTLADAPELAADDDPFAGVRHVSGKSTRDELGALAPSAAELALRDGLRRWVTAFVGVRIGLPDEVAIAREALVERGHFEGEPPRLARFADVWRAIPQAQTAAEVDLWLRAAAEAAPPVAAAIRKRSERRAEVARRLDLPHSWGLWVDTPPGAMQAAAWGVLDATEDLARTVRRETVGRDVSAAAILHAAVARDAGEGWPARPTTHWFEDAFGEGPKELPIRMPALPRPLGASSFARALEMFGFATRLAMAPTAMPFALSHDPASVSAHRFGLVFGALAANVEFQVRVLRLGRRSALAQARTLARVALLEARTEAARVLLGDDAAFAPADLFDEIGARLFEKPLPRRLRGAWPAPRRDAPARFIALLQALGMTNALRNRFDVDWFRNPRAWSHLRESTSGPAFEPIDETSLEPAARALGRTFSEAFG